MCEANFVATMTGTIQQPMPDRLFPLIDMLAVACLTLITGVSGTILAVDAEAPGAGSDELRLLLVPSVGAAIVSFVMFMWYLEWSSRRVMIGRFVISLMFGSGIPVAAGALSERAAAMAHHPVLLGLAGGITAALVFLLAKAVTDAIQNRSQRIGRQAVEQFEKRFGGTDLSQNRSRRRRD